MLAYLLSGLEPALVIVQVLDIQTLKHSPHIVGSCLTDVLYNKMEEDTQGLGFPGNRKDTNLGFISKLSLGNACGCKLNVNFQLISFVLCYPCFKGRPNVTFGSYTFITAVRNP